MRFPKIATTTDVLENNTNFTSLLPSQLIKSTQQLKAQQNTQRNNKDWGDTLGPKDADTLRLYFQNIHGIKIAEDSKTDWMDAQDKFKDMEAIEADIFGWAETNVAWTPQLNNNIKRHARNTFKQANVTTTSSSEHSERAYQMGGTLTAAVGKMTGRIIETGEDTTGMGRWTYICITGRYGKKVYIVNAYRVAANEKGENSAFQQQYRILRKKGVEKPNPRKQWLDDLAINIKEWKKQGEVIVACDLNSPLLDRDISKWLADCGLCDVLGTLHGPDSPNTHIKGSQTIDYLFATPMVMEAIRRGGMLRFHDGITSDHRGLWIDISILRLLRGEIHEITPRKRKKIMTKHKKRAKEFQEKVTEAIEAQRLLERSEDAVAQSDEITRDNLIATMQELDEEMDRCILQAEESMPSVPDYWWSDTLHHAHLTVKYWAARISLIRNNMDTEEAREELKRGITTEIDLDQGDPLRKPNAQLRKAIKKRKECRNNSYTLRQEYLERLADEAAEDGSITKETALRRMKETEASKRMYRLLRNYLKPEDRVGLNHIMVPDLETTHLLAAAYYWTSEGASTFTEAVLQSALLIETTPLDKIAKVMPHKRITIKEDMDDHLLAHHRRHFSQANGTPFTIPPLNKLVDFNASTPFCDAMRRGEAPIQDLPVDEDIKDYLEELQTYETDPPPIDTNYEVNHLIDGFKIWNESTATSPLGRYLGIYKVWIGKKGKVTKEGNNFFKILLNILLLAMILSEPLKRWATVHNLFLLKATGDYRVGRLRTIHKIDAELNGHRREFVARRLMRHAEKHNHLTEEQFGGRYGRTAADATLLTALTTETFTLQRSNAALTDCDAKACYDRILPPLVSLASHKAGLPYNLCKLYTKTLESMEYVMITGYGESEERNCTTKDNAIHGPGQGAADAPADWTLISSTNTKCYNKKATGCKLMDPSKKRVVLRNADLFVDDVKLLHNGEQFTITSKELKHQIQQDSTLWGRILWISGGLLEFDKSTYTILLWKFKPNGEPQLTPEEEINGGDVVITINGEKTVLQYTDSSVALKMLGVRQAGNQQSDTETTHILKKSIKFGAAITACPLRQHEIYRGYMTVYIPSLRYSLAATCLTDKQCGSIDNAILPVVARRLGLQRGFPKAVVTGPKYFGGFGLMTASGEQAVEKICAAVKHVRALTQVGNLFYVALAWAQLQAGVSYPILERTNEITHVEGRWFNILKSELATINGILHVEDVWLQSPLRHNDSFVMEKIMECKQIATSWHKEINYVRMYLRVTTIADIATSDGTQVRVIMMDTSAPRVQSNIQWPQQQKPSAESWRKWRKAIKTTFCYNGWKLLNPLGPWLQRPNVQTWYSPRSHSIYTQTNDQWKVWPITHSERRTLTVQRNYNCASPQEALHPVTDLQPVRETMQCTIPMAIQQPARTVRNGTTFKDYIATTPPWERQLLENLLETTTYMSLKTAISLDEEIWLVTDGGQDGDDGYFGWVIATASRVLWRGGGYVQGTAHLLESLRTESVSLLAMLRFLLRYCEYHHVIIKDNLTAHYCDNLALVRRMQWILVKPCTTPGDCLLADADVQIQIEDTLDELGISLTTRHVKGHQDDNVPVEKLKWEAQLNVLADSLATKARNRINQQQRTSEFQYLPACKAYLSIAGKVITRTHQQEIRKAWYTPALREHMCTKFKWRDTLCDDIDWEAVGRIHLGQDFYTQRFVTRFIFERLPLHGAKFTGSQDKTCPLCKNAIEDVEHFLCCTKNPEQMDNIVTKLRRVYVTNNVDPVLRMLLNAAVTQKSIGRVKLDNRGIRWTDYTDLVNNQAQLGWKQILYGRFSLEWAAHQQRYLSEMDDDTNDSVLWIGQFMTIIWTSMRLRWKARNSIIHKDSTKDGYKRQQDILFGKIERLYNEEQNVFVQDRHPFQRPIDEWKNKSVTEMKQWIKVNGPYITQCIKIREEQERNHTKDIRTYGEYKPAKRQTETRRQRKNTTKRKSTLATQESIVTYLSKAPPMQDPSQEDQHKTFKFRRKEATEEEPVAHYTQSKMWEFLKRTPGSNNRLDQE